MNAGGVLVATFMAMAMMEATAAVEHEHEEAVHAKWVPSDLPAFQHMHVLNATGPKLYYTPASNSTKWVLFGLAVPRGGWVGIGWSTDCEMVGADSVISGVGLESAVPATYDLTTAAGNKTAILYPTLAGILHSANMTTTAGEGVSLLSVNRSIDGGRVPINGSAMCLIWAYSDKYELGWHTMEKRGAVHIMDTSGDTAQQQTASANKENKNGAAAQTNAAAAIAVAFLLAFATAGANLFLG